MVEGKLKIINTDIENLKLVGYTDFGDKFRDELTLHKSFIYHLVKHGDVKIIPAIISSGEELALVYAGYKCECCGNEDDLQSHHLIQRNIKPFINSTKYVAQRFYWANIAVLCNVCHANFHGFPVKRFVAESKCITKEKINKVRNLYKIKKLEITN